MITAEIHLSHPVPFDFGNRHGPQLLQVLVNRCPNPDCREFELRVKLYDGEEFSEGIAVGYDGTMTAKKEGIRKTGTAKKTWALVPSSSAKEFPDYVPEPIRADYEEACAIVDLSPNASATLSRRCLQAMIRNFWDVRDKRSLWDEITAIEGELDDKIVDAIHSIRTLGKYGAHPEQDINLIIDVEPGEAEAMIALIELLIDDWYIAEHEREAKVKKVTDLAALKEAAKDDQ